MASSEQRLHSVLATLEQCRAVLAESTTREAAQLVSVAILQLRMTLNRIADSELKALCDAMTPDDRLETPRAPISPEGQRRRSTTVLKLIK